MLQPIVNFGPPRNTNMVTPILSAGQVTTGPSAVAASYGPVIGGNTAANLFNGTAFSRSQPIMDSGTLSHLYVNFPSGAGAAGTYQIIITHNGAIPTVSPLNCTIPNSGTSCSDVTDSLSVTAGDTAGIAVCPGAVFVAGVCTAAGTETANAVVQIGMLFTSTTGNHSFLAGFSSLSMSTSAENWIGLSGGLNNWQATNDNIISQVIPAAGVIDKLYVILTTAPGSGSWVFNLTHNGVDQSFSCSIISTNKTCEDASSTLSVSAGDTVSLNATPSSSPTSAGVTLWGMRWTPATFGRSLILSSDATSFPSATATNYNLANGMPNATATQANTYHAGMASFSVHGLTVLQSTVPGASKSRDICMNASSTSTCSSSNALTCNVGAAATTCTSVGGNDALSISQGTLFGIATTPNGGGNGTLTSFKVGAYMTVP